MKKWLYFGSFIVIAGLIVYIAIVTYPREIQLHANAVKYRLGSENVGTEQSVQITVNGKVSSHIFGKRTFKGTIDIEGENIPVPQDQRKLVIRMNKDSINGIVYSYVVNGAPHMYNYGDLYVNADFSKISIAVFDRDQDQSGGSWGAANGLMISAPASNREEALNVSNQLMGQRLQGYRLE